MADKYASAWFTTSIYIRTFYSYRLRSCFFKSPQNYILLATLIVHDNYVYYLQWTRHSILKHCQVISWDFKEPGSDTSSLRRILGQIRHRRVWNLSLSVHSECQPCTSICSWKSSDDMGFSILLSQTLGLLLSQSPLLMLAESGYINVSYDKGFRSSGDRCLSVPHLLIWNLSFGRIIDSSLANCTLSSSARFPGEHIFNIFSAVRSMIAKDFTDHRWPFTENCFTYDIGFSMRLRLALGLLWFLSSLLKLAHAVIIHACFSKDLVLVSLTFFRLSWTS